MGQKDMLEVEKDHNLSSKESSNTADSFIIDEKTRETGHESSVFSADISREAVDTGPKFSLMEKRAACRIVADYVDVTPDTIIDPSYVVVDEYFPLAVFVTKLQFRSDVALKATAKSTGDLGINVYTTVIGLDDIRIDHTTNTAEARVDDTSFEVDSSHYFLPKSKSAVTYLLNMFIILKENETEFLFEMPSISCEKGTIEGNTAEQDNEFYQYITVGKGRNRKMLNEETQTIARLAQSRNSLATRPDIKNAYAFASSWDMQDTYAKLGQKVEKEEDDEMVMYQEPHPSLLRRRNQKTVAQEPKAFEDIAKLARFYDAAILVERVLAAKEFSRQQKKYRGLVNTNLLSLELKYIYTLEPLWKFECEQTLEKPVTNVAFNSSNENIIAVSYGRFSVSDSRDGLVCIWCTKNPILPERKYFFNVPVASVRFSDVNPNWLACGFYNGDVLILDITYHDKTIIAQSTRETNPCFEPIWALKWRAADNSPMEYVMATCQDGRINKFSTTKTHDFICTPMMRLTSVEGQLKGLVTTEACVRADVPIRWNPGALCLHWHPTVHHEYYVGSDEGCIHRCSTNYLNQHIDVFRAHAGPVYAIAISPFMESLIVTCGADNSARLWIEGVDDIIVTLGCGAAVYGAAFCPINATVLLTISGNVLSVWDLRRKTHAPCADYTFASNTILTYINFSKSGDNVIVGETTGRVHTFHLEDMPVAPFYQRRMLEDALRRALCGRPELIKQLEKLNKL